MWKRLCSVTLVFLMCLASAQALVADDVGSRTAVVMDAQSGQILFEKSGDVAQPAGVASQMMTVLLVLEAHDDLTQTVTITPEMLNVPEGAPVLGLQEGEVVTVRNLLSAVMLDGCADASQALALFMADSLPAFVEQMNARATDWQGETAFTSAHGYDADGTITATALAELGGALSKLEKYGIMAKESVATLSATDARPETVIYTENVQIRPDSSRYDATVASVMGGKTDAAGWVQTTIAQDGLMTVSMGAPNGTTAVQDSQMLFDTARNDFTARTFTALQLSDMAKQASIPAPTEGFTDLNLHVPNGLDGQSMTLALDGTTLQLVAGENVMPVLGVDVVLPAPTSPRDEQPVAPDTSADTTAPSDTEPAEGAPISLSTILMLVGAVLLVSAGVVYAVMHMRHRKAHVDFDDYDDEEEYDEEVYEDEVPEEATPTLLFVDLTKSKPAEKQPQPAPQMEAVEQPEQPEQPVVVEESAPIVQPVVAKAKRETRTLSPNRGRQNRDDKRDALRQAYIEAFGISPEEALAQAEELARAEAEAVAIAQAEAEAAARNAVPEEIEETAEIEAPEAVEIEEVPTEQPEEIAPLADVMEQREMSTQELLALVESMKTLSGIPSPAVVHAQQANEAPVAPAEPERAVADIQNAQESVESTLKELEILMQETLDVVHTAETAPVEEIEATAEPVEVAPAVEEVAEAVKTAEEIEEIEAPAEEIVGEDVEPEEETTQVADDGIRHEDFEKTLELPTLTDDMIAQIDALKNM